MAKPPAKAQYIADQLAIRIAAGDYQAGQWLPGAQSIGDELGAERGTVRRALQMLAERGLVEIVAGNGARVLDRAVTRHNTVDMVQDVGNWRGFGAASLRAGGEPYADVASVGEVTAPPQVAHLLAIPLGEQVLLRDRVHGVVESGVRKPAEVALTWITLAAVERAPALRQVDTGHGGITRRLIDAGYELRYEDEVSARMADDTERARLKIDASQPVLTVWRRSYDQTDHVIKVSNRVINPQVHHLVHRYP
jgi:GntR family transcriptional regulator